ncbi:MAG: argininosuccinate lyase [Elusimicrobia bacterium]|nr:MAG: argininosuccinate lyase [Elusimicrobiota bacterium]
MNKLWQTEAGLDAQVESFTVGSDPELDLQLLPYEVYGSLAHAAGLVKIGILTKNQFAEIQKALKVLLDTPDIFTISQAQEDIHTAVEQALTESLGEAGAAIHAGRSRNDQVQTDLRLALMDKLLSLQQLAYTAAAEWISFGFANEKTLLPGYTHLQRAMPSTVGHWAASHAEALLEGARTLGRAFEEVDASPLGSAAGYGVPLPLDRDYTSKLLGFSRVQRNTLRVQSARPRVEAAAVSALALVAWDLGVLASDLSLYTTKEFGFLSLSSTFTTGSSIMPQKKNPDVVELLRAKASLFPGWVSQILAIGSLPSGYHRDYQITKGPLLDAFSTFEAMLSLTKALPGAITIHKERCEAAVTSEMMATHKALDKVQAGMPFRKAYLEVADEVRAVNGSAGPVSDVVLPSYEGAPGNPGWVALGKEARKGQSQIRDALRALHATWSRLLVLKP